jgi:hypothetical protein
MRLAGALLPGTLLLSFLARAERNETQRDMHLQGARYVNHNAAQLRAHPTVVDGVYLGYCGVHVNTTTPTRPYLYVTDYYDAPRCRAIRDVTKELGLELHIWLDMANSAKTIAKGKEAEMDMSALIATTVEAAQKHGWAGVNFDDESETCPRRDAAEFEGWLSAVGAWASGLEEHGLKLTVDVQALTCSTCSPWPACLEEPAETRLAEYERLGELFRTSPVHRWIEMDTYHGQLGYFYDQLDFYATHLPRERLGVGMLPNANPTNHDQTLARFHSIGLLDVPEVDIFKLPLNDAIAEEYFPALWKWKTKCDGCPQGALDCWGAAGAACAQAFLNQSSSYLTARADPQPAAQTEAQAVQPADKPRPKTEGKHFAGSRAARTLPSQIAGRAGKGEATERSVEGKKPTTAGETLPPGAAPGVQAPAQQAGEPAAWRPALETMRKSAGLPATAHRAEESAAFLTRSRRHFS